MQESVTVSSKLMALLKKAFENPNYIFQPSLPLIRCEAQCSTRGSFHCQMSSVHTNLRHLQAEKVTVAAILTFVAADFVCPCYSCCLCVFNNVHLYYLLAKLQLYITVSLTSKWILNTQTEIKLRRCFKWIYHLFLFLNVYKTITFSDINYSGNKHQISANANFKYSPPKIEPTSFAIFVFVLLSLSL